MVSTRQYSGYKSEPETLRDLRDIFEKWEVEKADYKVKPLEVGIGYEVTWWLPYDSKPHIVRCISQRTGAANLRVCYHFIAALQVNHLRGVQALYGQAEYLALAPGSVSSTDGAKQAASGQNIRQRKLGLRNLRAACEMFGIREDAEKEIVEACYRTLARKAHPDIGGTAEQMEKLNEARTLIFQRRGWTVEKAGEEQGQ